MFPTKEAGDYFNTNLVSIKYNLDKADPDNIKKTYGIKAFPTFIFLDGNGEEVARMIGGARDTEEFIFRVNARLKKYYKNKEDKLFLELFAKRGVEENFNKANIKYCIKNIHDLESPVIQYMLDNRKKVMKVMGKDEYNQFINTKVNSYINVNTYNKEKYEDDLKLVGENNMLHTSYYKFMNEAKDVYIAKDFNITLDIAGKYIKKATTVDRSSIVLCIKNMSMLPKSSRISTDKKDLIIKLLTKAALYEKDEKAKRGYNSDIESIKNSKIVINEEGRVKFESGNLKEAIAKAKAENKIVMIMGSASW